MKFYKTLNHYKCSNLVYDANSETAWSYEWYQLAGRFKGVMIVNDYSYSSTTARHVHKIETLFDDLGIKYINLHAPRGLQLLSEAKPYYEKLIAELQARIDNPRSKKHLAVERLNHLYELREKLALIEGFLAC